MSKKNLNTKITAEVWVKILVEKFVDKMIKLGITDTRKLLSSFTTEVVANTNGDVKRIELAWLFYSKFVDMGVGKGVKISQVGQKGIREQRRWFNPVFWGQLRALTRILAKKQAMKGALIVVENLDDK